MHDLASLLRHHEATFVFAAVLLEGFGMPVPAFPLIIVAAASLTEAGASFGGMLAAAFAAGVICDVSWYLAGRKLGFRLLRGLCRISLSVDSCVHRTESLFERWGASTLLVARFVPALSVVAQPLAGAVRQRFSDYLLHDLVGLALWIAAATVIGFAFSTAVDEALGLLGRFGAIGIALLLAMLGAYVAHRWFRRRAFLRQLRMERISVQDLRSLIDAGSAPPILDVRSAGARARVGAIPGSVAIDSAAEVAPAIIAARDVIVYCACPNEASAATLARQLLDRGVRRVRPLRGGIEAWTAAGFAVRPIATPSEPVPAS